MYGTVLPDFYSEEVCKKNEAYKGGSRVGGVCVIEFRTRKQQIYLDKRL